MPVMVATSKQSFDGSQWYDDSVYDSRLVRDLALLSRAFHEALGRARLEQQGKSFRWGLDNASRFTVSFQGLPCTAIRLHPK